MPPVHKRLHIHLDTTKPREALGRLPLRSSGHLAYGANPRYFVAPAKMRVRVLPLQRPKPLKKGARQKPDNARPAEAPLPPLF
jgi:hypothetical protein